MYFFAIIPYCVTGPDIFLGFTKQVAAEKVVYMHIISALTFWVMCANAHATLKEALKGWIKYHIFHNPLIAFQPADVKMQLDSLEREVEGGCSSLGISSQYFVVTNGFLGTVFQLSPT